MPFGLELESFFPRLISPAYLPKLVYGFATGTSLGRPLSVLIR